MVFNFYRRSRVDKHATNDWKFEATDDAFPGRFYRRPRFSVADAIQFHKEVHDPTMYDALNASLNMAVEMNMQGDKPTRLVSNFQKLVNIQHRFDHGQKHSILVFAKEEVSAYWAEPIFFEMNESLLLFHRRVAMMLYKLVLHRLVVQNW